MSAIARKVLALVGVIVTVFIVGYLSGLYWAPELTTHVSQQADDATDAHDHDHDEGQDDHDDDAHSHADDHGHAHDDSAHDHAHGSSDELPEDVEHLALTRQAYDNLGLKLGTVSLRDYWKSQTIPGEVVEIPGHSRLTISAPVAGVIDSVFVRPGQLIGVTDRLFTLRITDEYLTAAQTKLLAGVVRAEIVRKEIARLAPLTAAGAVAGRRKRDLEYELSQLESSQAVLRQEMQSRGLPNFMISAIANGRLLANSLEILAPDAVALPIIADSHPTRRVSLNKTITDTDYAIEDVKIHPGQAVERGDQLCELTDHSELYIRGQAFETDVPLLDQLVEKGWGITAQFGHDHLGAAGQTVIRSNLKLVRIDNEVGSESQTLTFFLPLVNEIAQTTHDGDSRSFVHWKFKPGQRLHLRVPVEKWENQIVLPLDAVMIDGPNATVFVEHDHGDEDDVFVEVVPKAVHLLHRDDRFAVVANDGTLSGELRIALNSAYKLHQAIQMQTAGGGHGHDHEH